jgi:hypothetical protein
MKKPVIIILLSLIIIKAFTQTDQRGLIDSALVPKPYLHYQKEYDLIKVLILANGKNKKTYIFHLLRLMKHISELKFLVLMKQKPGQLQVERGTFEYNDTYLVC